MSLRRAVFAAAAAAAAGVLLIGGGATYAAWSDSTESESTTITAGDLKAEISQVGPSDVTYGSNPSIYPSKDSQGIIPGVQAQRWSYTVTNLADSATSATSSLEIKGSIAKDAASDYAAIRPYLRAATKVGNKNETAIPNEKFDVSGFTHSVDLDTTLAPGESVKVQLTVSMPATVTSQGQTVDVAREVISRRSTNTSVQSVFTMTNSAHLVQAKPS